MYEEAKKREYRSRDCSVDKVFKKKRTVFYGMGGLRLLE